MRLRIVESGHRIRQKLLLALFPVLAGGKPTDFLRILMYRPEIFGKPFGRYAQVVLRGPSEWSVGERELFGGFVSRLNDCDFCALSIANRVVNALGRGKPLRNSVTAAPPFCSSGVTTVRKGFEPRPRRR